MLARRVVPKTARPEYVKNLDFRNTTKVITDMTKTPAYRPTVSFLPGQARQRMNTRGFHAHDADIRSIRR